VLTTVPKFLMHDSRILDTPQWDVPDLHQLDFLRAQ
jgi:hypothetical protein